MIGWGLGWDGLKRCGGGGGGGGVGWAEVCQLLGQLLPAQALPWLAQPGGCCPPAPAAHFPKPARTGHPHITTPLRLTLLPLTLQPHLALLTPNTHPQHPPPPPRPCLQWINDSCCNVLFRDAATAKRAVVGLGKPLPPEEMPDLQGGWLPNF